jgi:hypothetical protein
MALAGVDLEWPVRKKQIRIECAAAFNHYAHRVIAIQQVRSHSPRNCAVWRNHRQIVPSNFSNDFTLFINSLYMDGNGSTCRMKLEDDTIMLQRDSIYERMSLLKDAKIVRNVYVLAPSP